MKKQIITTLSNLKLDLVNPIILGRYDKFRFKGEACLSLPGLKIDTSRYNEIMIDNKGQKLVLAGLEAIVCQHEIDHMNGLTILDKKWRKRK